MRPIGHSGLCAVAVALSLTACSKVDEPAKSPAVAPPVAAKAEPLKALPQLAQRTPFGDLSALDKGAPDDLLKHELIGKTIRELVPQAQFGCMDNTMNYMRDLELQKDGSVMASSNGSHADQWIKAFVSASADGAFELVLACNPDGSSPSKYQYYTNSAEPGRSLLAWMYGVGREGDVIVKSDGKVAASIPFMKFVQALAPAKAPVAAVAAIPAQQATPALQAEPSKPKPEVPTSSVYGQWQCNSRNEAGTVGRTDFMFKPNGLVAYKAGAYTMVGYNLSIRDSKASGVFTEISKAQGSAPASLPIEIEFLSRSPGRIAFTSSISSNGKTAVASNDCTPVAQAPATQPARSAGGDVAVKYADRLAQQVERSGMPACQAIASNLRTMGTSGAPEAVRMRQVEAMFERVPGICLQ